MSSPAVAPIPEPGQIVELRYRRFVVGDVQKSTLPISPLSTGVSEAQHLVSLSSVDEDALGEELQVVWEVEPEARVFERLALPQPTGFDAPARLDAFLNAVR